MDRSPRTAESPFAEAIAGGELELASVLARELTRAAGAPLPLMAALELLALCAAQQVDRYDAWALRWLARWATETPGATIDQALDVAAGLAALPVEPEAIEALRSVSELAPASP
jgi:hypothetical protein